MAEMRFLRSVSNRLRSVIVTAFAIYGVVLLATALGYHFVGGWLAKRGTPFPSEVIVLTVLVVLGVILTDFVSRWWAGEVPRSGNDRFHISNAESRVMARVMARVIPIGFCFIAVMAYGLISTGTWMALPHSPGKHYELFNHGSLAVVSEARYRHVIEGNLLFEIGMSLTFFTMCYGSIRIQSVPKAPAWIAVLKARRTAGSSSS